MIGYVTLGTNNLQDAAAFYDKLLAPIGAGRIMDNETFIAWATDMDSPGISVTKPNDGNAATVGNGVMVALEVSSPGKVDEIYNKAMELGGSDEGAPGERMPGFYAGYFRDLDGNKLNAYFIDPTKMEMG
ncbi:VOC family protein [Emcibacter sp.]|uniref:VOC family protein n=1 Tax=Emcibacter sp. TaxID=1979954 RepID=UPI003A8E3DC5